MTRNYRIGVELCAFIGLINVLVYADLGHHWYSMLGAGWCFGMAWSIFDNECIAKNEDFCEFKRRHWSMVNIFKKG